MTTPFDTTRLDEECERIALGMRDDPTCEWAPWARTVRAVLLGEYRPSHVGMAQAVFDRCRRPKMVPA